MRILLFELIFGPSRENDVSGKIPGRKSIPIGISATDPRVDPPPPEWVQDPPSTLPLNCLIAAAGEGVSFWYFAENRRGFFLDCHVLGGVKFLVLGAGGGMVSLTAALFSASGLYGASHDQPADWACDYSLRGAVPSGPGLHRKESHACRNRFAF